MEENKYIENKDDSEVKFRDVKLSIGEKIKITIIIISLTALVGFIYASQLSTPTEWEGEVTSVESDGDKHYVNILKEDNTEEKYKISVDSFSYEPGDKVIYESQKKRYYLIFNGEDSISYLTSIVKIE